MTWDSDSPDSQRFTYLGVDNYQGGKAAADLLVRFMGEEGKVALLTGVPGAFNLEERIRGFKDGIAAYPGIEIVTTVYCNDDINLGVQVVEETMQANPDLDGWFFVGLWPLFAERGSMPLWEDAALNKGMTNIVFDTLPIELEFLKDGYVSGLVGQKYWGWGYDTVQMIYDHVTAGKAFESWTDSGMDIVTECNVDAMADMWATSDFTKTLPDAYACLEAAAAPAPEEDACAYGGEFASIEAVDDLTVKFTLCYPDVAFPSKLAFSAFAISPSEYLESTGGGGELVEKPIGTGPYKLAEWVRGDHLTLEANPDYWGEPAKTPTVIFRWSSEGAQRLLELESGTVDGIDNPTPDDFATIEANPDLKLYPREALNVFYVGFNRDYAPFDDEKVRQAMAMGIDRQRIVDNFYPVGSVVASHFTPCAIPGGCEGDAWYEFDPEAAKALLAEAGFPDGFETTITYRDVVRGYLPEPGVVAQDIQAQLAENLGIKAEIVVMESGAFIDAANAGQIQGIHLLGWGADYPDQTNFLDFHFGSGATPQFGAGFEDIWEVLKQAGSTTDLAERKTLYADANGLIKEHVPMVPVAHGGSATVFKATVEGAHSSPLTSEEFEVMAIPGQDTLVWMQNAEPIGLYCADETDGESLRACEQINESLLAYKTAGTEVIPSLAESYEANADLTEWTLKLRPDVTFHDGSAFDAQDVIASFNAWWDAANPTHVGRVGDFAYFSALFGAFKNAPPAE